MIKKFSEHINEDYFSKLANRKDNGNVRLGAYGNLNKLRPIEIGLKDDEYNIVWSSENFVIDDYQYFNFNEYRNFNVKGWRLPVLSDYINTICDIQYKSPDRISFDDNKKAYVIRGCRDFLTGEYVDLEFPPLGRFSEYEDGTTKIEFPENVLLMMNDVRYDNFGTKNNTIYNYISISEEHGQTVCEVEHLGVAEVHLIPIRLVKDKNKF